MQQSTPRVSVVIPAYNNASYLPCAIDSALAQGYRDLEVIVVDDASTDETADVLAGYDDPRLRIVTNPAQQGIAGARNRGIEAARGEYTAALDSDDWAHPNRLAEQVMFLDTHPDHAVVGSWARWMDPDGQPLSTVTRRPIRSADAAAQLIFKSSLQQPSVTGRTAVLQEYAYDENFDLSSDYELWVRVAERYRLASQPLALVTCRRHASSTTYGVSERVAARQRTIFAYQLERMGMDYQTEDLDRHRLIWRSSKHDRRMDGHDLDWAEDWLARLATANARQGVYEPAAFDRVLGWGWLHMCRSVARSDLRLAAIRGLRSPLRRSAAAGAASQVARLIERRPRIWRSPKRSTDQ